MFAVLCNYRPIQPRERYAKFAGFQVVKVSPRIEGQLRRNKHVAVFQDRDLAEKLASVANPEYTEGYRVKSMIFANFTIQQVEAARQGI